MHNAIPTEYLPEFLGQQRRDHRHVSSTQNSCPLVWATVRCLNHKRRALQYQPFPRLLEAADRLPRTSDQTEKVPHPAEQRRLDHHRQSRGDNHLRTGRPGEGLASESGF